MSRLSWLLPARAAEATPQQRIATGAAGYGPPDRWDTRPDDHGFRRAGGTSAREIPERTREQARTDSIAGYRANPMARAIIDTYVAFCVGDSGLALTCSSDVVRPIAESFWTDPANMLQSNKELMCRSWLILGELLQEMMVGPMTGICRRSPIDPTRVCGVDLDRGNALWPAVVHVRNGPGEDPTPVTAIRIDDLTGLRAGQALWWPSWRTLETDTRGAPFLMPVLDWLDNYDQILSNLIDHTALIRHAAWDVTVEGDKTQVDEFIAARGGVHAPRSGTIEVHNESVKWAPIDAKTGAGEDTTTAKAAQTLIAAGAGLAKTWLAEPEDANRATSLTMAEPVRRRVGSVQNEWLAALTEMVRFAVDQAVAAQRIPLLVDVPTEAGTVQMPAADTVSITGPQVAAADAKVAAEVLHRLSLSIKELQAVKGDDGRPLMSAAAGRELARRGWETFMNVPYRADLDGPEMDTDKVAEHVDDHDGGIDLLAA